MALSITRSSSYMLSNGEISFRPVSTTCAVGTFTSKSPTEYKALIFNPPPPGR